VEKKVETTSGFEKDSSNRIVSKVMNLILWCQELIETAADSGGISLERKIPVAVVPLDQVPIEIAQRLSASLAETLSLDANVEKSEAEAPRQAFNPSRGQYDASRIISGFERSEAGFLLLVTDLDLFVAGLNFCFGLAQRRTAIVSLHRLKPQFYGERSDESLLVCRAEKEAVHEVCHLIGLRHCRDPLCVMHFSNWIGDTDIKGKRPCKDCLQKIKSLMT